MVQCPDTCGEPERKRRFEGEGRIEQDDSRRNCHVHEPGLDRLTAIFVRDPGQVAEFGCRKGGRNCQVRQILVAILGQRSRYRFGRIYRAAPAQAD